MCYGHKYANVNYMWNKITHKAKKIERRMVKMNNVSSSQCVDGTNV